MSVPPQELKESNPKDSVGVKKVSMSTIPAGVLGELAVAMSEGALKYGRHNYREVGVRWSVYHDAAMRHLMAFEEGENDDVESNLSHLIKVMSCMTVLRDGMLRGNWVDDRPPKMQPGWINELNKKTVRLQELYPHPPPAYTELARHPADKPE
jgi:hypothetical protein